MLKKFVLIFVMLSCSISEAAERFVTFPAIGICTGTYVRYREDPDTESDILGRLNKPQNVIVLSQTATNGQVWYEIENPEEDSTAWVFGKYIVPLFDETTQQSELYPVAVKIVQTYGINPVKGNLYGGPKAETEYRRGNLVRVEVSKKRNKFGEISIGDNESKLIDMLGIPDRKDGNRLQYINGDDFRMEFFIEDGKVCRMLYQNLSVNR